MRLMRFLRIYASGFRRCDDDADTDFATQRRATLDEDAAKSMAFRQKMMLI
jgi:hypothetical protein